MSFRITHLGAENCVTGSSHLLRANGVIILIDCGLCQGDDECLPFDDWPVSPSEIDYLFITHAHIDHIGRLPDFIESGFDGEIICTHPTKALLLPMLNDAMGFSGRSDDRIKKLSRVIDDLSWGFEYRKSFSLKKGIRFKLGNAGHILGSSFIRFESENPKWSIIFSGDIGSVDTPILPDPDTPDSCDLLVLESTYGDSLHGDRRQRIRRLGTVLSRALADRGKVFIPAFSLGRTQELIYEMDRLFSDETFRDIFPVLHGNQKIPVFIDSPLGLAITEIYKGLSGFWDSEAVNLKSLGDNPMDFDHLYAVKGFHEHVRLKDMKGPAVIIAGNGMCSGGRIVGHLEKGLADARNDVVFVGYQGKGTTGRKIIEYGKRQGGYVYLNGEKIKIKAGIHSLSGYSAHADQAGFLKWVKSMPEKPELIRLVHGEPEAKKAFADVLMENGYAVDP